MHNHQDYASICGRLRALETQLLTPALLERLMDGQTPEDCYRVLNDFAFLAPHIADYPLQDFQKVFTAGLNDMLGLISALSPYRVPSDLLLFKYDFHNLKVVLKARLAQRGYADVSHALVSLGHVSTTDWENYMVNHQPPVLSAFGNVISRCELAYEANQDLQEVDLIVDKHLMELTLKQVRTLNSPLLLDYFKRLIDFMNLKTFIRGQVTARKSESFHGLVIPGGHAGVDVFIEAFDKDLDALKAGLDRKLFSEGMLEVIDAYNQDPNLLSVEKKVGDLLQAFMHASSRIAFGPEPVFAFFWRFENHLQIIRTVLIGQLNQLSNEDIKKQTLVL